MRGYGVFLAFGALAVSAQPLLPLVERPFSSSPALWTRTSRIDSTLWAWTIQVKLSDWEDYAFDTLIEVRFRLHSEEKKTYADTVIALPMGALWRGSFLWPLSSDLAAQWIYLEAAPKEVPELALYARVYLPAGIAKAHVESLSALLSLPTALRLRDGRSLSLTPQDTLWSQFFEPALVDTALPALPYVLTSTKVRWIRIPCAWHLRGDTAQVFWTCGLPAPTYTKRPNPTWQTEARFLFSDRKPGERTDFGLIYTAWGPPPLRLYTTTYETWVYPAQKLSFQFQREGSTWRLQRRLEYQAVWK